MVWDGITTPKYYNANATHVGIGPIVAASMAMTVDLLQAFLTLSDALQAVIKSKSTNLALLETSRYNIPIMSLAVPPRMTLRLYTAQIPSSVRPQYTPAWSTTLEVDAA